MVEDGDKHLIIKDQPGNSSTLKRKRDGNKNDQKKWTDSINVWHEAEHERTLNTPRVKDGRSLVSNKETSWPSSGWRSRRFFVTPMQLHTSVTPPEVTGWSVVCQLHPPTPRWPSLDEQLINFTVTVRTCRCITTNNFMLNTIIPYNKTKTDRSALLYRP